ncbi:hypothetical protein DPMN_190023 [Dreissena polymorpha]|uniref:G-protein coupled receptors family 2 profile 2 domain-containing protein n=1 Tax=Dreissena polymorpha TaxID=45954 RepID=A0A9D4DWJ9_DREPO|nr:hypothetical protein DPMN_190023 [Dreissena polymorpha]
MLTENTLGYGGRPCYLTNPRSILFFVAIPLSVVMVVNLVMYISVIVKIMRLPEIGEGKSRERNNLKIFVKLSTITGLTWIFGIVYVLTDVGLFGFLFILFNASQGVFIMFSFVSTNVLPACSAKRITLRLEAGLHRSQLFPLQT